MQVFLLLAAGLLMIWALLKGARWAMGARREAEVGGGREERPSDRFTRSDNNLLDDVGRTPDRFADRTGAVTRAELGAPEARNVSFDRTREEGPPDTAGSAAQGTATGPGAARTAAAPGSPADEADADRRRTVTEAAGAPGKRDQEVASIDADNPWVVARSRERYQPGPNDLPGARTSPEHVGGPPQQVRAGVRREERPASAGNDVTDGGSLAPEDEFGEDRPANRTDAPDQQPTRWHPEEHGTPGQRLRDGHHRSGTAPERITTATDPYAHAPVPGPAHVPPEGGWPTDPREIPPTGENK